MDIFSQAVLIYITCIKQKSVWTIYTHGVIGEVETAGAKGTQVKAIKTTMGKAVKLRFRYKRLTDKVK